MELFEVGGCVRDELLGIKSKDIDFSVVLSPEDFGVASLQVVTRDPFEFMVTSLSDQGVKIFRDKENVPIGAEFFTARGQAPKDFPVHPGRALDFVLARKESGYSDGRRPDKVEIGTLMDDLQRRDFTMNAIAKDSEGNLIDPFNGAQDINERVIRAVGNAFDRLNEDALRALRALRFSVTKGFRIDREVQFAMESAAVLNKIENVISDERIKDELSTMFKFDTLGSLSALQSFPALTRAVFSGRVSLDSTLKQRGRGEATSKSNLPVAHHGCACACHQFPGIKHMAACCRA